MFPLAWPHFLLEELFWNLSGKCKYEQLKKKTLGAYEHEKQPENIINQKANIHIFHFSVLFLEPEHFNIHNKYLTKYLTNNTWGLKPADSNAWHISSAELSPHKHFQKKKLPEVKRLVNMMNEIQCHSLSLTFIQNLLIRSCWVQ